MTRPLAAGAAALALLAGCSSISSGRVVGLHYPEQHVAWREDVERWLAASCPDSRDGMPAA